jgi:hypothetical protein
MNRARRVRFPRPVPALRGATKAGDEGRQGPSARPEDGTDLPRAANKAEQVRVTRLGQPDSQTACRRFGSSRGHQGFHRLSLSRESPFGVEYSSRNAATGANTGLLGASWTAWVRVGRGVRNELTLIFRSAVGRLDEEAGSIRFRAPEADDPGIAIEPVVPGVLVESIQIRLFGA